MNEGTTKRVVRAADRKQLSGAFNMYMPDPRFADQRLTFPGFGMLIRFPFRPIEHLEPDDAYREVMRELAKEGSHRNVYLVNSRQEPIWRIADYEQTLPDYVSDIRPSAVPEQAAGVTFDGWILAITLSDGSVTKLERTR